MADLFRSLYPTLYPYVLRVVGVQDAEDVLIETFATVWAVRERLPAGADDRRAWVFGIAHNEVREHVRGAQRRATLAVRLDGLPVEQADGIDESVAALDWSRSVLDRLPRDEREALSLTVFGGLTPGEAAVVLGCERSTVNSRAHRARRRLRSLVQGEVSDG